jgi:hypothetical protein
MLLMLGKALHYDDHSKFILVNIVALSCPFDLLAVVKMLIYFIFVDVLLFSVLVIGGEESVALDAGVFSEILISV